MLLTVGEIRDALRLKLSSTTFRQMALDGPGVSEEIVESAADSIGTALPEDFIAYVTQFDFSRLRMHGLSFQYGAGLQRFTAINVGSPLPWWRGDKPGHAIWTSHTDGHMLIMDGTAGTIRAFDKATSLDRGVISTSFDCLIRGAGTLAARETKDNRVDIAREVASDVGAESDAFWKQLATRSA